PGGAEVTVNFLDARVGGSYQFEGKSSDGTRILTTGTYVEIRFPEKLVFTWISTFNQNQETLVTIEFIERGASTEVILTHDRFANDERFMFYQQGWSSMLDRLASALSALS